MLFYYMMGVWLLLVYVLINGIFVCLLCFSVSIVLVLIENEWIINFYFVLILYYDMVNNFDFLFDWVWSVCKLGYVGVLMIDGLIV